MNHIHSQSSKLAFFCLENGTLSTAFQGNFVKVMNFVIFFQFGALFLVSLFLIEVPKFHCAYAKKSLSKKKARRPTQEQAITGCVSLFFFNSFFSQSCVINIKGTADLVHIWGASQGPWAPPGNGHKNASSHIHIL